MKRYLLPICAVALMLFALTFTTLSPSKVQATSPATPARLFRVDLTITLLPSEETLTEHFDRSDPTSAWAAARARAQALQQTGYERENPDDSQSIFAVSTTIREMGGV